MAIRFISKATVKNKLPRSSNIWDGTAVFNPFTLVGNYDALATVTVAAGGVSSITFAGIPQTGYAHLQLRGIARSNGIADNSTMRFNGDTGNNYASHYLIGDGSSASAGASASRSNMYLDVIAANSSGAYWSADIIDILDYTNNNKNKTIRALAGQDLNGSGTVWLASGLWANTSAVNSITIGTNGSGNLAQYSQFALYGVKS